VLPKCRQGQAERLTALHVYHRPSTGSRNGGQSRTYDLLAVENQFRTRQRADIPGVLAINRKDLAASNEDKLPLHRR